MDAKTWPAATLVVAALLAFTSPAAAGRLVGEEPRLEPVASAIAGRPLTVLCYRHGEPGDPLLWLADELLPWALAVHFKKTTLSRAYDWPGCRVPVFYDSWR